MFQISISYDFRKVWPNIKLVCIECDVTMEELNTKLWATIDQYCKQISSSLKIEDISTIPSIATSRKAYRALGQDPARYRLSAEALLRRVVKGNGLYQINNVVDIVNLSSVLSGFSIGGYDVDQINGNIGLGIGRKNEPYEAIGRGDLNIGFLPVLRDVSGAFGSPTSDSMRTSVTLKTRRFLMIYFGFGAHSELEKATGEAKNLLEMYASAQNINQFIVV